MWNYYLLLCNQMTLLLHAVVFAYARVLSMSIGGARFAEQMLQGKVEEGSAVDKQNYK